MWVSPVMKRRVLTKCVQFNCTTCRQSFPSKTKLFDHLKKNPGHAKLVPIQGSGGGGGKKKKAKR